MAIDGQQERNEEKEIEDDRSGVFSFSLLLTLSFLSFLPLILTDPNKKENIAAESALMVPDTRQRLAAIVADTRKLLVRDRVGFFLSFSFFLSSPPPPSSEQLSLSLLPCISHDF